MPQSAAEREQILDFWNRRAEEFGPDPAANTPDPWIHRVEIAAISNILAILPAPADILDLGCANGHTTFLLHQAFPQHRFLGGDLSEKMIAVAQQRPDSDAHTGFIGLDFEVVDMMEMERFAGRFDAVLTIRSLLNLPDSAAQWRAIANIAASLKPGGHYIAVENFTQAQENLNAVRADLGLEPLPYRWNNCWFDEAEFRMRCSAHFALQEFLPITSAYYLVTRAVYSKMCQQEDRAPDYDHPIYEIATRLPSVGDFGPVKLSHWVKE